MSLYRTVWKFTSRMLNVSTQFTLIPGGGGDSINRRGGDNTLLGGDAQNSSMEIMELIGSAHLIHTPKKLQRIYKIDSIKLRPE